MYFSFEDLWEISNINIYYLFFSVVYLWTVSKKINFNEFSRKSNFKLAIYNIFSVFVFLSIVFFRWLNESLKLLILFLITLLYNIYIKKFKLNAALIISCIYWNFSYIHILVNVLIGDWTVNIFKNSIYRQYYLILLQIILLVVFVLAIYFCLFLIMKDNILLEVAYPDDKKKMILTFVFYIFLICCLLVDTFFYSFKIFNIKILNSVYMVMLLYIFYYIFLLISKLDMVKFPGLIKKELESDLILNASAKREDRLIKEINSLTRKYSSVMKSDVLSYFDPADNEIYHSLQKALNSFYCEYYTNDDILNEIMSEKSLTCSELGMIFFSNIIKVDTSTLDAHLRKKYYAILSLAIDFVIVNSVAQEKTKNMLKSTTKNNTEKNNIEKYIIVDIINFSKSLSLQITASNYIKNKIWNKNRLIKSKEYQILSRLVGVFAGKLRFAMTDETLSLVVVL